MEQNTHASISVSWIAGFWKRIGALFLDSIILGIVGFLLGLVFKDFFASLGGWGIIIGFGISLLYFGVLNSNIAGGQTFGKRLLKIRVVNSSNTTIGLSKSIMRFCIIGIPYFMNGSHIIENSILSFWTILNSLIIFGGLFTITYLFLFNKLTRQSLHDLILGTYVVNAQAENQSVPTIWKPHLIIVGTICIIAIILPFIINNFIQTTFTDLMKVQNSLIADSSVKYAAVTFGETKFSSFNSETSSSTYISANVFLINNQIMNVELSRQLAKKIITTYPEALNINVLQVSLIYGFDIGIASQWFKRHYKFAPGEYGK